MSLDLKMMSSGPNVSMASFHQARYRRAAAERQRMQTVYESPVDENNIDEVMQDFKDFLRGLFQAYNEDELLQFNDSDEEEGEMDQIVQ